MYICLSNLLTYGPGIVCFDAEGWMLYGGEMLTVVTNDEPHHTSHLPSQRRDTEKYLLCTSGAKTSVVWSLDPYLGELTSEQIHTTGRGEQTRENLVVEFSADRETIYCGTTSGDFALINVRLMKLSKTVPACKLGITSLLSWPEGVICGGGDGTITTFDSTYNDIQQCQLDGPIVAMSFSPDKAEVVAGTSKG